jgi:hypothetical protein
MIYTKNQIDLLSKALLGDKTAHKRLETENYNLFRLHGALRGSSQDIEWLLKNDKMLAAFDDAVGGNRTAVRALIKLKEPAWAAMANYVHGDDIALQWLKKHGMEHYYKLAKCILKMLEDEAGKDVSLLFKP